jgi:hypothetical protein
MKCEDGAAIRTRAYSDAASMHIHGLLDDCEAEAGTDGRRTFATPEPLED